MLQYDLKDNPDAFVSFGPTEGQLRTLEAGIALLERQGCWLAGTDERPYSFELGNILEKGSRENTPTSLQKVIALRRGIGPNSEIREIIPQLRPEADGIV